MFSVAINVVDGTQIYAKYFVVKLPHYTRIRNITQLALNELLSAHKLEKYVNKYVSLIKIQKPISVLVL